MLKKLMIAFLIFPIAVQAADFTIEFDPSPNSVGNNEVSTITSSKISDFASAAVAALTSTLSNFLKKSDIKAPSIVVLTYASNPSGTYTAPAGVKWIEVEMVGGGGGGGGAGTTSGTTTSNAAGTNGGASTFGGLTANGGESGKWYQSGGGGTISGSIPEAVIITSLQGGYAESGQLSPTTANNTQLLGGMGGISCFGSGGVSAAGGSGTPALVYGAGAGG